MVHPKTRLWPSPSGGIIARYNPPSMLWPVTPEARYAVRMSQAPDFTGEVIGREDLPFAMFNAHRQLAPGLWYWQYKTSGGAWSEASSFLITLETPLFVTPEGGALVDGIPEARPRILSWSSEADALRERAAGYAETQEILREAEEWIRASLPDEREAVPRAEGRNAREDRKLAIDAGKRLGNRVSDAIMSLAQAYLLTGESRYADAGCKWLQHVGAWDAAGPTQASDFGVSQIMVALAVGLDTFGSACSGEERVALVGATAERARMFYEEWKNSVEARAYSAHVWQYMLHRFIQTSIGLIGDVPEADQWLAYAYELWIARAPVLGGDDGAWYNGLSYFGINTRTLLDVPAIFQDLTGVDFLRSPWYENNPSWLLYAFPPHSTCDGFGNGCEKLLSQDLSLIAYADALARVTGNPWAAWYADESISGTGWRVSSDRELRWYRVQRGYRQERPAPLAPLDLPDARVFRDGGLAYLHSDLRDGEANLMVAMRAGPFGSMSHAHADQNTFNIAFGGQRLFFNTGYRPAMGDPHYLGWFKHTQGHNGVLIDGKGQPEEAGDAYGWIPRFLHGSRVSYAVGDASQAYASEEGGEGEAAGLTRFRRHILMLRPTIVVVYDDLEADHDAEWSWLIHCNDKMDVDEVQCTFAAHNAVAQGRAALFGSVPLRCVLSDQFTVKPENWRDLRDEEGEVIAYHDQWHFKGVTTEKTKRMRYLAIIQVQAKDSPTDFAEVRRDEGNRFEVGEWSIEAELRASEPPTIRVENRAAGAAFASSGPVLAGGKEYNGSCEESAKLVEMVDGKPAFFEAVDEMPASMGDALKQIRSD
ncbi:MAG: DUF4962 domain-containing protein [Candidatus Hydrogenedentes bacterium]|nr:DUF4962 domain-containing protein [Candidatus Hydrogenedentota bacterium]